jgi:hypothetical protein
MVRSAEFPEASYVSAMGFDDAFGDGESEPDADLSLARRLLKAIEHVIDVIRIPAPESKGPTPASVF